MVSFPLKTDVQATVARILDGVVEHRARFSRIRSAEDPEVEWSYPDLQLAVGQAHMPGLILSIDLVAETDDEEFAVWFVLKYC